MPSINLKTTNLPYSLSTVKPDHSKSSAKALLPTPAPPYSLSTIKSTQSKSSARAIQPTPTVPYSWGTFNPAQSKTLAKPVVPTLALEWSDWPKTKPIKGTFAQPFDEQTKDSLQADFNFFGMDGEDTVFELREGKGHGNYQTRSQFENNIASYQSVRVEGEHGSSRAHTVASNIISQEKAKDAAKEIISTKSTAQLKSIAKVKKSANAPAKGINYESALQNKGNKEELLARLKNNEDTFWRSKTPAKQSIEELLSVDISASTTTNANLQTITTHNELIKHCELLHASNAKENLSVIYTGKPQSAADAIAEGDAKKVTQLLADGVSYEAIDAMWKRRPTHPRVCKCGCQMNEAPHSYDVWCRCGCGRYYVG